MWHLFVAQAKWSGHEPPRQQCQIREVDAWGKENQFSTVPKHCCLDVLLLVQHTLSVPQRMSFDFFGIKFAGSSYSKNFIIIIYFHSDLVYHTIYFNYDWFFSMFSQMFWIRRASQTWCKKNQMTFFMRQMEYIAMLVRNQESMAQAQEYLMLHTYLFLCYADSSWSLPAAEPAQQHHPRVQERVWELRCRAVHLSTWWRLDSTARRCQYGHWAFALAGTHQWPPQLGRCAPAQPDEVHAPSAAESRRQVRGDCARENYVEEKII